MKILCLRCFLTSAGSQYRIWKVSHSDALLIVLGWDLRPTFQVYTSCLSKYNLHTLVIKLIRLIFIIPCVMYPYRFEDVMVSLSACVSIRVKHWADCVLCLCRVLVSVFIKPRAGVQDPCWTIAKGESNITAT